MGLPAEVVPVTRQPGVFVHLLEPEQAQRLVKITRTAKDRVRLRRAVLSSCERAAVGDGALVPKRRQRSANSFHLLRTERQCTDRVSLRLATDIIEREPDTQRPSSISHLDQLP